MSSGFNEIFFEALFYMSSLPENIESIVRTLASVMHDRGEELLVAILQHSSIDIRETSYDNWNGGTYGYTLHLQISVDLFGQTQDNLETIEKKLLAKFKPLTRSYDNEYLENIIISPKILNFLMMLVVQTQKFHQTLRPLDFGKLDFLGFYLHIYLIKKRWLRKFREC